MFEKSIQPNELKKMIGHFNEKKTSIAGPVWESDQID